jgi:hypothetical protein
VHFFYVHSNQHVPGFITQAEQLKAKGVDEILLISGMLAYLSVFVKTVVLIIFSLQIPELNKKQCGQTYIVHSDTVIFLMFFA